MKSTTDPVSFWDDELAALDERATAIFGEEAVFDTIQRLTPPAGAEMTLARVLEYRQAVKTELRKMVRPQ